MISAALTAEVGLREGTGSLAQDIGIMSVRFQGGDHCLP